MSTTLCGHARPYDLCHECEEIRYQRVVGAARAYERAWDRYANPDRYPDDPGNETDRILAKARAHQALLDAVRAAGAP